MDCHLLSSPGFYDVFWECSGKKLAGNSTKLCRSGGGVDDSLEAH
jgi:hypothetical protein